MRIVGTHFIAIGVVLMWEHPTIRQLHVLLYLELLGLHVLLNLELHVLLYIELHVLLNLELLGQVERPLSPGLRELERPRICEREGRGWGEGFPRHKPHPLLLNLRET